MMTRNNALRDSTLQNTDMKLAMENVLKHLKKLKREQKKKLKKLNVSYFK